MLFDFSRLRGRIVEKFGSCERFAAKMGRSKVWLSVRLSNAVQWRAEEIREAAEILEIPVEEIPSFFLVRKF